MIALSCLILCLSAKADERILSFDSDILIATTGTMTVTETIRVQAEGVNIRRGIYRDFPTRYRDRIGNRVVIAFEVQTVTRDGITEPWFTESRSNGVRLYIGNADTLLAPGIYDYQIRYQTDRQLGYFDNHDELYWNVTGNGWDFVIDSASARVRLPGNIAASDLSLEGYTGPEGGNGQDYTTDTGESVATIRTTAGLQSREGLTLVLGWPKGIVTEPGNLQNLIFLLQDNLGLLLALSTLLLITAYLLVMWSRFGRDPAPGVIFPQYQPPENYSPASARYISRMGYDTRTFTAAVINLAVKGHLSISKTSDDYELKKLSSDASLAPGEKQLKKTLFAEANSVVLDNKNHQVIGKARRMHARALKNNYLNTYFVKNSGLLLPCVLLLVLMLIAVAIFDTFSISIIVITVAIMLMTGAFVWLLKAPTDEGRTLLDKLEGFKLFLNVAEKDDLDLKNPPDITPTLFEKYLPYAIALGVEQPWAERFAREFASLNGTAAHHYQPLWYVGNFDSRDLAGFTSDIGAGVTTAISSASQPPGSSSGAGGGGFSGGGGGGGGGGGW